MTKRHYLSFLSAAFMVMALYIAGNAVGFFVKPITAELGFTRGAFSLYLSLTTLTGVFILPFIGQFLPKFGAKKLLAIGGTWVSLGFVWLANASPTMAILCCGHLFGSAHVADYDVLGYPLDKQLV